MDYTSTLPYGVLVKIFGGLTPPNPNCVRFLCAAASVCPNWREAAKEPCLWRHLRVDANQWQLIEQLTGPRLRNLVARSHNTLTWLELERCPLVNEAALTLSLLQQPCLVYVSFQGCESISREGLAHALCDAENFQGVVEQLNNPRQSVADAQRCCVALCTLLDSVLATAGAMGLFIKALYLDVTNESIRFAAVEGIGAIALSKAALPQASLGIDAVMRPLRDSDSIHNELITGSGKLMAATRKTLGIYLRFPSTRERAIQAGAEYAVQGIEYYEAERERERQLYY